MSAEEDSSHSKKQLTSWIWQYFKEGTKEVKDGENVINVPIIICQVKDDLSSKICNTEYVRKGSSTGNAISHLRTKHNIMQSGKLSDQSELPRKGKRHTKQQQKELRQFLVDWIVLDSLPLNIVQSEAFRRFINELDPAFTMPCPETVKGMIYEAYNYSFPQLKEMLSTQATSVSLTMDLWTARNRQGYLGVTCSYLDQSFKLCEFTLDITYVRYPHTARHIKDTLESILNEWNIYEKVFTITTDNASNMKKCVQDMEGVNHLGCTAHTLQLVVGKGMKPAEVLIGRAKQLIDFFMRPKQSERLEDAQKNFPELSEELEKEMIDEENDQETIEPGDTSKYLHTIADSPTRWNSSYLAWNRLLLLKNHINVVLTSLSTKSDQESKRDYKTLQSIMLSSEEWDLLKELKPVLQPFAEATDLLGGSNYCTFSIMNPILIQIKKQFTPSYNIDQDYGINFQNEETAFDDIEEEEQPLQSSANSRRDRLKNPVNTQGLLNKIKSALYISLNHYWKNLNRPDVLLPSLLDPRTKELSFVSSDKCDDAKDLLREMVQSSASQPTQQNKSPEKKKKHTILAGLKKQPTQSYDEITEYLQLEEIDFESNPFTWWREREVKFPILSLLAKKYLSVYACSTASERLFSDAGNLLTAKRTRISPDLFKKLIFLKRNAKHLNSIHKPDDSD